MDNLPQSENINRKIKLRYHYKFNHKTVRQYLKEKRKNLKLNRRHFYRDKIKKTFHTTSGVSAAAYLKNNRKKLIKVAVAKTKRDPWVVQKCLEDIQKECKSQKYRLKFNEKKTSKAIVKLIDKNYDAFIKNGRTRIYM